MKPVFTRLGKLHGIFPNAKVPAKVKAKAIDITSPEDRFYNCVAWAMGDDQKWWEPFDGTFPLTHWPIARTGYGIADYVAMFRSQGYEVCDDGTYLDAVDKIVIYVNDEDRFTHVSRQTVDPRPGWLSKCGGLSDIWHDTPELLEGPSYGRVWGFMSRAKP